MVKVKLETYCVDACNDTDFLDNHITVFVARRKNIKKAINELHFQKELRGRLRPMTVREFLLEYTWDWSEKVYYWLYDNNMIVKEWIERCAI